MVKHKSLLVLLFCVLCLCFTFSVNAATPTKYTVKFIDNFDGKETVLSTQTVEKGRTATAPSKIPTHKGFEFSKWSTKYNKVNKNLVIKAVYKQTQSIIYFVDKTSKEKTTFYLNGVKKTITGDLLTKYTKYVDKNGKVTNLPKLPDKPGYTFITWNGIKEGQVLKTPKVIMATTKYATKTYKVIFKSGNNAATGKMKDQTITIGKSTALTGNAFKLKGYTFAGWQAPNGQTYQNKQKVIDLTTGDSITLTATWTPETYKITYNTGVKETFEQKAPYTYHDETYIGSTTWYCDRNTGKMLRYEHHKITTKVRDEDTPDIFYKGAYTEANRYRRVDKNGKGVADELQKVTLGPTSYTPNDSFVLPDLQRTYYNFKGWKDSVSKKTSTHMILEKGSFGNRTYTAVWEKKKYTIIFKYSNGKSVTKTYTVDNAFNTVPQNEKVDHTIYMWECKNYFRNTLPGQTISGSTMFTSSSKIGMILQLMDINNVSSIELTGMGDIGPALEAIYE